MKLFLLLSILLVSLSILIANVESFANKHSGYADVMKNQLRSKLHSSSLSNKIKGVSVQRQEATKSMRGLKGTNGEEVYELYLLVELSEEPNKEEEKEMPEIIGFLVVQYVVDNTKVQTMDNTESISRLRKEGVFCPEDIRECSDGSYVSRDPENNCEFTPCPGSSDGSTQQKGFHLSRCRLVMLMLTFPVFLGLLYMITLCCCVGRKPVTSDQIDTSDIEIENVESDSNDEDEKEGDVDDIYQPYHYIPVPLNNYYYPGNSQPGSFVPLQFVSEDTGDVVNTSVNQ